MRAIVGVRFNLIATVATLGITLLLWGSCGRGGSEDDSGSGAGDEEQEPPTIEPEVKDVSGRFFYGSTDAPAAGSELWVLNHSTATINYVALSDLGAFKLPLKFFVEDEVYSFHLVKDGQLIGDVDLAQATADVQTAFTYRGGYGFELGDVIVPLDRHGALDLTAGGLKGKTGGGFSLVSDVEADFSTFPLPSFLTAASVGSHLNVMDPFALLNSFYLRGDHPLDYGRDLAVWSRIGALVVAKAKDGIDRAFVEEGATWFRGARLAANGESAPNASPLWADTDFELMTVTSQIRRASAYLGSVPKAQAILVLRVSPKGGAQVVVPRALDRILTMPPTVVGADAAGGASATIDYESTTLANGLTRPFCQSGVVSLELAPPLDQTGQPVLATTLNRIDVEFDYFKRVGGQAPQLKQTLKSFASPYNAAHEDEDGDMKRVWDASLLRLRYEVGATSGAAATQQIQIPTELLPAKIGSDSVGKVRLRIYYRSETDATEGGVVVWLDKGC